MRSPSKSYRLGWPEMVVLPIVVTIAVGVFTLWIMGVLSLAGYSHQRFDIAMVGVAIKCELLLALPVWLLLRGAAVGVRVLSRLFRPGRRIAVSAVLLPSS